MAKKKPAPAAPAPAPRADGRPRLSAHPRARRQIREAKAWAGLVGFVLVALLSLQGGSPLFDAGVRALIAGAGCYVVGWALALAVWRHVARAEVKLFEQRLLEEPEPGAQPYPAR
jgi:protein-S-isoprenylcysteine O-methyltransferase Ste14